MTMGDRLKAERQRIGLNQTDLAAKCGVSKNTQLGYEKGERSPDASYLEKAHALGIDVMYIVINERRSILPDRISADAEELLRTYQLISETDRAVLLRTAQAFAKANM